MVSKQYEVPEVTYLLWVFRIALEISLFTGLWMGSNHYLMCCKRVNVIVPMSICVTTLVEKNVSSTCIEEAESPCERLSKPKCSMNLTFSKSEFRSVFLMLKSMCFKKKNNNCNIFYYWNHAGDKYRAFGNCCAVFCFFLKKPWEVHIFSLLSEGKITYWLK